MPEDYRSSWVQSWFISVQRALWHGALLDVAYIANRADDLLLFANYNQARPNNSAGTLTLQQRRPIPECADITYSFNGGKSRCKALQTKFEWRMGPGFSILNSLTLSETKDNGAGSLENTAGNFPAPQDINNMEADFGRVSPALQQHDQPRARPSGRRGPQVPEQCVAGRRRAGRWLAGGAESQLWGLWRSPARSIRVSCRSG